MQYFSKNELYHYNGLHGMPAYVSYAGKVFDVSSSPLWKNGNHQVLHRAGRDLSDELADAPHSKLKLEKFPVVGFLEEE